MKNAVNYYYNLTIDSFTSSNSTYYIKSGEDTFMFVKTNRSIKEMNDIYDLFNRVRNNYYTNKSIFNFFHKIVLNKDYSLCTVIDKSCYVLLKLSNINDEVISIYDIKNLINTTNNNHIFTNYTSLIRFNWENMWKEKIDYIEYQIEHLSISIEEIIPVVHYFIGMAENAIYYINKISRTLITKQQELIGLSICHKRLCSNTKMTDFFNPFNIVIDHPSRDISEYLKSSFINDDYDFQIIEEFLYQLNFSNIDYNLLFARLLFPSFFLDLYIDSINDNQFDKILNFKKRSEEYQLFLKNIYFIISKRVELFKVDWLIK